MKVALFTFWACFALAGYVWFGYPALLWVLARVFRRRRELVTARAGRHASVSILIAVHNEESELSAKLQNCLALAYPSDRLQVVVASDGSTDNTNRLAGEFARTYPNVELQANRLRRGKTAAQNAALETLNGEIVLFSDADTRFAPDFLDAITRPFADANVGCVTGRVAWSNTQASAIAGGGSIYWRYEHWLWDVESRLGMLAWGSGACLAVRTSLLAPIEAQYGEDCVVPLEVVSRGYRVVFCPDATAEEVATVRPSNEVRARARMTLRSFTGTLSRAHLLNPCRFPGVAWAIISHKLLRWFTPYLIVLFFISNLLLVHFAVFYQMTIVLQILFFLGATTGYVLDGQRIRLPLISTVYAFVVMNLGVAIGVTQAFLGHRIVAYQSE